MRNTPLSLFALSSLLVFSAGCTGETFLSNGAPDEDDNYPEFDGASLEVSSPSSAAIYLLDEGLPLQASVLSSDGEVLDFEDIVWSSDAEGELATGTDEEVDLDWGIKTFTVTADLPNGDRLQTVIGGVRVQGRHSGIYGGDLAINLQAEFEGTPITASCLGGLHFVVDMSGELLLGEEGSCTINLVVMGELDIGYGVEAEVAEDSAQGSIQINTGFIDIPVDFEAEFEDDMLTAEFEGNALLFTFDGSIEADRLSPYVEP